MSCYLKNAESYQASGNTSQVDHIWQIDCAYEMHSHLRRTS